MTRDLDEFGEIARLFRPLTLGAPEALNLADDAAVLRPPAGQELVVTTDTLVAGVHFLAATPYDLVARKLLRVNLSDLAAKAAAPWGWFLNVAWPEDAGVADREALAAGLAQDQAAFGLSLFGGDTVRTGGPLTLCATLMGSAPIGETVRRDGARAGDALRVTGPIGAAGLGLAVLSGDAGAPEGEDARAFVARHRLPEPRLDLREALRRHACAAADVSDGLLADAMHVARASGLGLEVRLEAVPVPAAARAWLLRQDDETAARLRLATSGDDYELVLASASPDAPGVEIGRFTSEPGLRVLFRGVDVTPAKLGWTHG